MKSDLTLDCSAFCGEISESTKRTNEQLTQLCQAEFEQKTKWWNIGANEYRRKRAEGKTAFPKPVFLDTARTADIPSRTAERDIPVRYFVPRGKIQGIFFHIHGGGWVLSSYNAQDTYLSRVAEETGLVAITVEYRLAPEHPWPAPDDDCLDVARFLSSPAAMSMLPLNALTSKVLFVGGESAGAHLTARTVIALRDKYKQAVSGMVLNYGVFDLSMTPSALNSELPLVLNRYDMEEFYKAYLPSQANVKSAEISPLFADLVQLCPALFQCGTHDCLLDDTLFMSTKYIVAGNQAIVKLYPGAPHGFITMNGDQATRGISTMIEWLNEQLASK